jgi:hypothetical protein
VVLLIPLCIVWDEHQLAGRSCASFDHAVGAARIGQCKHLADIGPQPTTSEKARKLRELPRGDSDQNGTRPHLATGG